MHRTTRPWLIVPVLLALAAAHARAQDPATSYYGLVREGKTLGYATLQEPVREQRDGREVEVLRATLVLDVSALGERIRMDSRSTTVLDAATGDLIAYDWESVRGATTRKLACTVADGKMTITRQAAEGTQTTTEADYTADTFAWGENDVAGLSVLVRRMRLAPGEKREITVIGPDQVSKVPLEGLEAAPRTVLGEEREARRLSIAGAITLCVGLADDRLLAVDMADGTPVLEATDADVVTRAQAEAGADVLASHFIKSEVAFADFTQVARLVAEVEFDTPVIGGGVTKPESPMQRFEGTVEGSKIRGTVTIESVPYAGENAVDFPIASDPPEDVARYLEPSQFIESDDAAIADQAKQLAEGATNAWEATRRIAKWVSENVAYTIADSPSAKLALTTRKGDCGPHATLTIAMLRALGIPAKLVGGLTYAPQYGGSFGQHAWVEAWMGDRWVCLDPTTGEIDSLSAVHIKAFEGLGMIVPTKLHIVERVGGGEAAGGALVERPLPWQLGRDYVYLYRMGDKELGAETVRFERGPEGAGYIATSTGTLGDDGKQDLAFRRTLTLGEDLRPTGWHSEATTAAGTGTLEATFEGGKVTIATTGPNGPQPVRSVDLAEGVLILENNSMLSMALAGVRMRLTPGETASYDFLTIDNAMTMALAFTPAAETTEWQGVVCRAVEFPMGGATLFITDDGRFLGQKGPGELAIEVSEAVE